MDDRLEEGHFIKYCGSLYGTSQGGLDALYSSLEIRAPERPAASTGTDHPEEENASRQLQGPPEHCEPSPDESLQPVPQQQLQQNVQKQAALQAKAALQVSCDRLSELLTEHDPRWGRARLVMQTCTVGLERILCDIVQENSAPSQPMQTYEKAPDGMGMKSSKGRKNVAEIKAGVSQEIL